MIKKVNKYHPFKWLILICAITLSTHLTNAKQYCGPFQYLTVKDGLSQNSVFSITEDSHGFMWFGTRAGGLNRFDGYNFKAYKKKENDSSSISGNEIISLLEDNNGYLWVGTRNNGLNKYNPNFDNFTRYEKTPNDSNSFISNTVNSIFKNTDGVMWFGTNNGLCYYNSNTESFIRVQNKNLSHRRITTIAASSSPNHIWIGNKSGLYFYNLKTYQILAHFSNQTKNPHGLSHSDITAILEDKNGYIWLGTKDKGISKMLSYKKGTFAHFRHNALNKAGLTSNVIRTINQDSKGAIWIGTKIALEKLLPDQHKSKNPEFVHFFEEAKDEQRLNQNSIFSFYEDSNNNYWIGTYTGGINYLYSGTVKFRHFKHNRNITESLSEDVVSSFASNNQGLWIGTEGGGLNLLDFETQKFKHYSCDKTPSNQLKNKHIKTLHIDSEDQLWIGTYSGLYTFDLDKNKFKLILEENIYDIEDGINNELWVGTHNGIVKINKKNFTTKTYQHTSNESSSLSNNYISKIYKDLEENIWIATKYGLNLYNKEMDNFKHFFYKQNIKTSLSHSKVTCLCKDTLGNLWVGTLDGLNRFDFKTKKFTHFNENNGLPSNLITNILLDNNGHLWITTIIDLIKLDPYALNDPSTLNNIIVRKYNDLDGLHQGEFRQNSAHKDSLGNIYLGGANGFCILHPNKMEDNTNIPPVVITDFKLFNKSVTITAEESPLQYNISRTKKITLNHTQSIFSFSFASLDYVCSEKNNYAYKLEGFDKDWVYINNHREVTYTDLPYGEYTFKVKASNNDNIWNTKGTAIEIIILPPWWKTKLFQYLVALIIFLCMLRLYFYKVSELEKQKELLELKVIERTDQLQKTNSQLEESHKQVVKQKAAILNQNKELENKNEKIENAYKNIETISKVGNELIINRDVKNIIEIAYRSLCSIMKAPVFSIGIYQPEENCLFFTGTKEGGKTLNPYKHNLNRTDRFSVYCFKKQKEILIKELDVEYSDYITNPVEDTGRLIPHSVIYVPLKVKEKKIGVITIQSNKPRAYNINHLNIIRSFGVYVAIALDNANAYDKIERQAQKLRAQKLWLEETNATKNKFYSILTHDLKTPFNAMLGFLEILELSFNELPKKKTLEYINIVSKSAKLSYLFMENLLEWSQVQQNFIPFKPKQIKVIDAIYKQAKLLESMVKEKNINLKLQSTQNGTLVHADEYMLNTILRNLVSNAIKFTQIGGQVEIYATQETNRVLFTISDTGIGIPEEHIHNLFRLDKKFTRVGTNKEMGTGMGLALCKEFVEKHKGEIWAISKENEGTSFHFTIPSDNT